MMGIKEKRKKWSVQVSSGQVWDFNGRHLKRRDRWGRKATDTCIHTDKQTTTRGDAR